MKRIVFLLMLGIFCTPGIGQTITDGLRYSLDDTQGTARFSAMSGAFGALGGDLSAMAINPAGSAVFLDNSFAGSFTYQNLENRATYFGTQTASEEDAFDLNHLGGVFVFNNPNAESPWKKFSIGINYNQTQNFDNQLYIDGRANNTIGSFFLNQAQGIPLEELEVFSDETINGRYSILGETRGVGAQNAFLGYQTFIIDPATTNPEGTTYVSNIASGSFDQEYTFLSQGYQAKYTLNVGTQFTDNFFFGANLNSHIINYDQSTFLFEANDNEGSTVDRVRFEENLSVLGAGFSAQIGAIAKVGDGFRLGLSLETPTYFTISEETSQAIETRRLQDDDTFNEVVAPGVINVYPDYNLRTPGKVTASAAYIFGGEGLISFDYGYKDYSNIEFRPDDDAVFAAENAFIESQLKGASSYRLGGEYRIQNFSLRGGFRYEESMYVNETTLGDLTGYSLGLGYNFGKLHLDVAYATAERNRNQQLYATGLTTRGAVNTTNSNVVVTLGLQL
ncbi:MAG: transporter [Flavobacteriaceae bacterium]|nr:transporter [Flavobacteriaceae bacterium]|tara:strand:- start:1970 stop:3487 length:1518 start_codon:yes stop_codon:yes gene_type:complete